MVSAMLLSSVGFTVAKPDEGMYTPDQIAKLPLKARGLKISPEEIYNPRGGGLSEAVVRLSIGCSAEFVSPDGLILTNHHCGYDALVAASTPEKNYGEVGYRSGNRGEELPAKGYSIDIPERTEEVTVQVTKGTDDLTGAERAQAIHSNVDKVLEAEKAKVPENAKADIKALDQNRIGFSYGSTTI